MRTWRKGAATALVALAIMVAGALASAQVPQTIVLDGVNDFNIANRIAQDGLDTQFSQIDIGDVYVTNDAVKLYIGIAHDKGTWGTVQLGIAIDVNTAAGGSADPWGRKIEWSSAPYKPDYMFYVNYDNNWQAGYQWNGTTWAGLGAGPGALGWTTGTGFKEIGILLSTLGVTAGQTIRLEAWVTQDGATKGPLDCVVNNGSQLSTPTFTLWDTSTPVPLTEMYPYTVLNAADNTPPTLTRAVKLAPSTIDLTFSEPVSAATANVPGNYALAGAPGVTVNAAARDVTFPYIVHLTLSSDISASAGLYSLTVTGVRDLATNLIVANGATNKACFAIKNLLFRGRMSYYLASNSSPPDQFSIEGDMAPLTFDPLCDTGVMTAGTGGLYTWSSDFCVLGNCAAASADTVLRWKFAHNCATYEPLAANRTHTLRLGTGARDTLDFWWNNEDPTQFTTHPIDVEYFVDMNAAGVVGGDLVGVNGSVPPLNYDAPPTTLMRDDGVAPDVTAGDKIFARKIRFPTGARKNVLYKYLHNANYECFGQGDRNVYLNDALFDTVGGAHGALVLPLAHWDACNATWRAVKVIFRLDLNNTAYTHLKPTAVLAVNGTPSSTTPALFNWDIPSLNPLKDDGVAPDLVAGDHIWSRAVTFADSSGLNLEYKYLLNGVYECVTVPNRVLHLNPDNYDAAGNPQIVTDKFQHCNTTGIDLPDLVTVLTQNRPNPFNPRTEILFSAPQGGRALLCVYDARGQLVRTLIRGEVAAGEHAAMWDGTAEDGRPLGSGVYFYRLDLNGQVETRKMMLVK